MKDGIKNFTLKYKINEMKFIDLVWLIIIPVININYVIAAIFTEKGNDISLIIDKKIPYISLFIFPYIYWYVFVFLGVIFILIKDRNRYLRTVIVISISMCICYVFYYLYPVEMTRPTIASNTIPNKIVNLIYSIDKPLNCFPSIHVLNTYILMRFTKFKDNKLWFIYTNIVGVLIILSTLFIKQHFVLDAVAAIIITEVIIIINKRINDNYIDNALKLPYKIIKKVNGKIKIPIN